MGSARRASAVNRPLSATSAEPWLHEAMQLGQSENNPDAGPQPGLAEPAYRGYVDVR